jgi:hypothetical protein
LLVFLAAIALVLSVRSQSQAQRAYGRTFARWNSGELSKNFIFVTDSTLDINRFYFKERDFSPRKILSEDFLRLLVDSDVHPPSDELGQSSMNLKIVELLKRVRQLRY